MGILHNARRLAGKTYRSLRPKHRPGHLAAKEVASVRDELSWRYIKGRGLEIGALDRPLDVPLLTRVTYVDRMPLAQLREHYPEAGRIVFDVVDDGEGLHTIAAGSQDFLIANHFIEHAQDPIGTIARHLEVLKKGGILFMAVPDGRLTFDYRRPPTTLEHMLHDHADGGKSSYDEHVVEYSALVDNLVGQELQERIEFIKKTNYSIHYHVWHHETLQAFLAHLGEKLGLPMRLKELRPNKHLAEIIAVIEKT